MSSIRYFFNFILDLFFGCWHNHLTRPFTLDQRTYMVCIDCGKRVYYSTDRMQPMKSREIREMNMAINESRDNVIAMPAGMPASMRVSNVNSGRSNNSAA